MAKRYRRNPSIGTMAAIGGVAVVGVGVYLWTRKRAAEASTPADGQTSVDSLTTVAPKLTASPSTIVAALSKTVTKSAPKMQLRSLTQPTMKPAIPLIVKTIQPLKYEEQPFKFTDPNMQGLGGAMYGQSIFGDSVGARTPDPSRAQPIYPQAPGLDPSVPQHIVAGASGRARPSNLGVLSPVDYRWPLTHSAQRTESVMGSRGTMQVIGGAPTPPPGAMVPVDVNRSLTQSRGVMAPIGAMRGTRAVVGRMRDPVPTLTPTQEQRYWNSWVNKFYPGIFHPPAYVGPGRYGSGHPGGMPTLSGFGAVRRLPPAYATNGYRGLGAAPDGLIGFG